MNDDVRVYVDAAVYLYLVVGVVLSGVSLSRSRVTEVYRFFGTICLWSLAWPFLVRYFFTVKKVKWPKQEPFEKPELPLGKK